MSRPRRSILILTALMVACITSPQGGPVPLEGLADGSYEAHSVSFPNAATVRVSVQDGQLTEVELVTHNASRVGHQCDDVLPGRMVEQQSTMVDAVSGATNSSNVIMDAAGKALEQAVNSD